MKRVLRASGIIAVMLISAIISACGPKIVPGADLTGRKFIESDLRDI